MPDRDAVVGAPRLQSTSLGLGERLRSARKARAISVGQIAEALKIEEAGVLALEEERFEALGAPVFVRGHLRRYAQLVGLSPEAVLEAYRSAAPESDALPLVARRRERSDVVQIGPWVYWLAAALIIAGIVIALGGGENGGSPPAESGAVPGTRLPPEPVRTPAVTTPQPVGSPMAGKEPPVSGEPAAQP